MLALAFGVLTAAFLFIVPDKRLKIIALIYFVILYVTLGGVMGFLQAINDKENSFLMLLSIYLVIVILHLPLLVKIRQIDHKNSKINRAREFFGREVLHLNNEQLHLHLKKHH